jgi:hypothetical protein
MGFRLITQRGEVSASLTWITVNMQAELRDPARVPGRRPSEGCDGCRYLHSADRMGAGPCRRGIPVGG